jgi:5-methylcytosine-specific restriction endonuclease McrA
MRTTKAKKKADMKALIDKYGTEELFSQQDVCTINQITGWEFKLYKRVAQPFGGYANSPRHLAHLASNGSWYIWSWNKAIDGVLDSDRKNLLQAMRKAIRKERDEFFKNNPLKCPKCSTTKNLGVDHTYPPFSFLADEFIKKNPNIKNFLKNNADGKGWFICDFKILTQWISEHWANASLQIMCQKCNSEKGARPQIQEEFA